MLVVTGAQAVADIAAGKHLIRPKEKVKAIPGTRGQIQKADQAAFKRIAKPGKKLSPMEQILVNKIKEAERKAAKAAKAAAARSAKGGGRRDRRRQNRSPHPEEAEVATAAAPAPAAAARGPAKGRRPQAQPAAAAAGKPQRRHPAAADGGRKEAGSGDPVADVVREIVARAVSGAVRTTLQDTREQSAIRAVLSAPDVGARQVAGGSGVKAVRAVRAVRASESLPQVGNPSKRQRGAARSMAYGAAGGGNGGGRSRRDRSRSKAGKPPGAVALPPLAAGVAAS